VAYGSHVTSAPGERLIGSTDLPGYPIVWVGALVAAALLVVAGCFFWAASESDRALFARESEIIDHAIRQQGASLARELKVQTVWTEGYEKANASDRSWLHEFYGAYLSDLLGYDGIYLLGSAGQPVFGYRNGHDVEPAAFDGLMPAIGDLVAEMRRPDAGKTSRYNLIETKLKLDGHDVTHRAIADIRNIQGRRTLVVLATLLPDIYPAEGIVSPPFLLVALYPADAAFVSRLGTTFGFDKLRWLDGKADAGTSAKVVRSADGSAVGVLGWERDDSEMQFFWRIMAGVLAALLLLLSLAVVLSRIDKKRTERLMANAAEAQLLARIAAEAQHLVRTDALTGLPNRLALDEALSELGNDELGPAAALYLDIDGFKEINDIYGRAIGDRVIVTIAGFLKSQLPDRAILARAGGDEFAVLLTGAQAEDAARTLAETVIVSLTEPFDIDQRILRLGLSIGIAVQDGETGEGRELLRRADLAMYAAKTQGRSCYIVFDKEMDLSRQARQEIEDALRKALDRDEFELVYQPIVDARSRRIVGVEALLRWPRGPAAGLPPDYFIPIAEETGLIGAIGLWVLKRACADALAWKDVVLNVNVSPAQLRDPNFPAKVRTVLEATGFPPARLKLEITEGYLIQHRERAKHILSQIKQLGIGIGLDDFGTGYASIGYLRDFGFDCLKLDRSITATVGVTGPAAAVLHATIAFAQVLSMSVVAEGVETEEQAFLLGIAGCDKLQGYWFGGPQQMPGITRLLRRQSGARRAKAAA